MAGVLGQLFKPQKVAVQDRKAMELEAAREILVEVFGVKLSEVDEMIENRFQAGNEVERRYREDGLWPLELLGGRIKPLVYRLGSLWPPILLSIHKIRSRGDCEMLSLIMSGSIT